MMLFFVTLISFFAYTAEPVHWNYLVSIDEQHEFYESSTPLDKPKNSWQVLFSLTYLDKSLNYLKDCVYYRIPGDEPGILKIKTMAFEEPCDKSVFIKGDQEITGVKSLQFTLGEKEIAIDFSTSDFKNEKWIARFQTSFQQPEAKMHLSSSEFKSPKIIYLAPENKTVKKSKESLIDDKTVCHEIDDDCGETSPNLCSQCKHGWFEVPNGCPVGPKVCGTLNCGDKDGPACRRGNKWQRIETALDCQTDSSFAYCKKGLKVVCEGRKAFCR